MDSAPSLREPSQRVSTRARSMWTVEALTVATMVAAVAVVLVALFDVADPPWWLWLLGALVLAAYVLVMPLWRWRTHRWEVTDTAVYTQTGWWARERPMSRIQTVDHIEGLVARLFGLATVTVTTASAAGALEIAGLDKDVARRLVAELTVKADAVDGDAT
jgi:membrane protein YdbS with pleckstrin-like domain